MTPRTLMVATCICTFLQVCRQSSRSSHHQVAKVFLPATAIKKKTTKEISTAILIEKVNNLPKIKKKPVISNNHNSKNKKKQQGQ